MQTLAMSIPPRQHYTYTACGGPQQERDQIVLLPWVVAIPNNVAQARKSPECAGSQEVPRG